MSSITERAQQGRRQRAERPQPHFIARAKVGNGWVSIGAAWPLRSGDEGYSLKLNTLPAWLGRTLRAPPAARRWRGQKFSGRLKRQGPQRAGLFPRSHFVL